MPRLQSCQRGALGPGGIQQQHPGQCQHFLIVSLNFLLVIFLFFSLKRFDLVKILKKLFFSLNIVLENLLLDKQISGSHLCLLPNLTLELLHRLLQSPKSRLERI